MCCSLFLYPLLHSTPCSRPPFTPYSQVVVLDVLLPPYAEENGRDCHYLALVDGGPGDPSSNDGIAHLGVTAAPSDLVIRAGTYRGPPVSVKGVAGEGFS